MSMPRLVQRPPAEGTRPTDGERARLAALADEPLPSLVVAPMPVSRKRSAADVPAWGELRIAAADPGTATAADRLKRGASLGRDTSFVPAPAYDEEHPEELSYRPFPIAPFLTATASVDDPALARIVHPDLAKTLEMLDQAASVPPMRLRPGSQTAQLLWAQQFKGEAINLSSLIDLDRADGSRPGSPSAASSPRRMSDIGTQAHALRVEPGSRISLCEDPDDSALRLRLGRRRAWAGLAAAPLAHEVVELGAVLGHAQPLQERAELVGLLLQPAQGLVAVFVEGAVAAGPHARRAAPLLHPPFPALALALPPLGRALAPLLHVPFVRIPSFVRSI